MSTPRIDLRTQTHAVNDATYAAWNAHDVVRGRAAIRDRAAMLLAAFPDFRLERQLLVVDGERHADRWIMTGTHRGELLGLPPTGRTIRVEGATFPRLGADGLVVEDVHYVDYAGLMAQLSG